ncbi:DUF5009 domain-containing protein [Leptospira sp. 201903070]|uniref:DUF5009 domain-containing protein n=1 Tax=Leptospira ainlahdjerensis TaxID=2810033 RepID=A0ABS2UGX1_9LEPT|nr:DUF5009 domain-containing protein [Leptospira ainlahdjerensis]MBM9579614.1 DUF5009 domain-containing protein [Leptospira ainlahdjerensis]
MENSEVKKKRILSLDLFRGMTVAGMILVNNPGSWSFIYAPLKHAKWNGCTPTDLVFPFFLFAVGASIPIALNSKKETSKGRIWVRILKRSFLLFAIGLFLNFFGEWSLENLRIPGVLQRIAFVYFIVSTFYLFLSSNADPSEGRNPDSSFWKIFEGRIFPFLIFVLFFHSWILTNVVPPGAISVSLEEGKDIGAWLDRVILGEKHIWKFSKTWDPEGFFSGFGAVASSLMGMICGRILLNEENTSRKITLLLALGGLFTLCGLVWDRFLPMNKSLWTGSYAVFTGGLAFLSVFFFESLDVWARRNPIQRVPLENIFQPFLVFGKNAILVFAASGLVARIFNLWLISAENGKTIPVKTFFYWKLNLIFNSYDASLSYALIQILFWWGILSLLDRRKIYWKV